MNLKKSSIISIMLALCLSFLLSCKNDDDDDPIEPTGNTKSYNLSATSGAQVSGTVTFTELSDNSVEVKVDLNGTSNGESYTADLRSNSAVESGNVVLSLQTVDGTSGTSTTIVRTLDDGSDVSFQSLSNYDGHISVYSGTITVAQGDIGQNVLTGESMEYTLEERAVEGISGTATFYKRQSGEALAVLSLVGTPDGGEHPAHIHVNTAIEGGGIAFSFNPVNGSTGMSMTNMSSLDDGTEFSYSDLTDFDGYVNVHLSAEDLGTIVAQGDIGQNVLTGESMEYTLEERAVEGISGTATFYERQSGEALAVLSLVGTPDGGMHPAHIHVNTAAEGGAIAFSFNPVNGSTGMSMKNMSALDDGTAFGYSDLADFDGYINVHLSADDLGTIVAQGDIGQNILTGESMRYTLLDKNASGISGTATFYERQSGEALAVLSLAGTPDGGMHPAHIHVNTAAEGGAIAFSFNPVNGSTGMSMKNMSALDDGTAFGYSDLADFDGYINVHLSAEDLGTIVAQGDIGQNILTGESMRYTLGEKNIPGINGTVTFYERQSGEALAEILLVGTPDGGQHPAHIHLNTAVEGGGIAFTFTPVDGSMGESLTNVATLDDGTAFGYSDLADFDGYINVHLSAEDLATIVAQGDIGQNVLTGESVEYTLEERDVAGINGTATFYERKNGEALAVLALAGTPDDGEHPAHIHMNSAEEGGDIAFTFPPVNGLTGFSMTNVSSLDDETVFGYSDIIEYDGYINVHLSADDLATIVAQGNIGSNAN